MKHRWLCVCVLCVRVHAFGRACVCGMSVGCISPRVMRLARLRLRAAGDAPTDGRTRLRTDAAASLFHASPLASQTRGSANATTKCELQKELRTKTGEIPYIIQLQTSFDFRSNL